MNPARLTARDYFDPALPAEASAGKLADAVIASLAQNPRIHIDFGGVRGIASSYYNIVLSRIAATTGPGVLTNCLSYDFDTTTQRTVFERSLAAFRRVAG